MNPAQKNFSLQTTSPCGHSGCEGYHIGAIPCEDIPAAPPYFSINTGSASGEVLLRWINPAKTFQGNPLDTLSAVHIWRNDTLIAELTDFTGADTLEFSDQLPQPDYYRYTIRAVDSAGSKGCRLYGIESWQGGPINGIVIWELDKTPITGSAFHSLLRSAEYSAPIYVSRSAVRYPLESALDLVIVCLGIYPNNHVLADEEAQLLKNYLDAGGNVYMEGGDTWYFDTQTVVHPYFKINATADGSEDLSMVDGQAGTPYQEMSFTYTGENSWMDHIEATPQSQRILKNHTLGTGVGVACVGNEYKTIGTAFEFGGLVDGASPSTKKDLLMAMLEFFGIQITAITPPVAGNVPSEFQLKPNFPNPFNSSTAFTFGLPGRGEVEFTIYDLAGRKVFQENLGEREAGWHVFRWNGQANRGAGVASGVYFYRFAYRDLRNRVILQSGKLHLVR